MTGYQPIRDQNFLIRSVHASLFHKFNSVPYSSITIETIDLTTLVVPPTVEFECSTVCLLLVTCMIRTGEIVRIRNRPNQKILVTDWLIASHVI